MIIFGRLRSKAKATAGFNIFEQRQFPSKLCQIFTDASFEETKWLIPFGGMKSMIKVTAGSYDLSSQRFLQN